VRRALALAGIEQRGVYLNPGDIMQLVSRAN
jgi:hypothetical protein